VAVFGYAMYEQWPHAVVRQPAVVVGALIAFVVGYGVAGVCAYLLIGVLRRELEARRTSTPHAAASGGPSTGAKRRPEAVEETSE